MIESLARTGRIEEAEELASALAASRMGSDPQEVGFQITRRMSSGLALAGNARAAMEPALQMEAGARRGILAMDVAIALWRSSRTVDG